MVKDWLMPRCYPPVPEFGEGRHGERTVWEALQQALPDEAVLMYSTWLVEDGHEHEIDFLVAWPNVGIGVIEVKGGHVTRDDSGRWYMSKGQERRQTAPPLVQASDARHALQRYLKRTGAPAAGARVQHLIALPHMPVPKDYNPADCPRHQVIDQHDLPEIAAALKAAIERGDGHAPLAAADVQQLVTLLTAQLPGQASLLTEAEEHEQLVDQMTRDQARTLDSFRHHKRLAIIGGAGTGKTWLALEQAKRLAKDNQRVGLLCYSRGLGRYLQRVTSTWGKPPAYTGLFHDLAIEWGAPARSGDESDYYEEELPRALGDLAAARQAADLFDAVVIDEAQDFGELWWSSLLACLRDPDQGGLYVFMDQAQRVFSRQSTPPIAIPPYVLTSNIRNTKRIAQVFGSLSAEQSHYRGLQGPPVRFIQCAPDEAVSRADDAVEELLDTWQPGQVALLTTKHKHPLQDEVVLGHGWAEYWDEFFAEETVFYGHVLGFKGLERQVVVLAINGFKQPERAKEMLYVGLSRARTQLVVCGDLAEIARVGGEGVRKRLAAAAQS